MTADVQLAAGDPGPKAPVVYLAHLMTTAGQVVKVEHLPAKDDDEAIRAAKALVDGHAVDLWEGLRFIEHFPAEE